MDFAHLAPGQRFAGRYAIYRLLRAGGMGAVFEATHLQTHRRVALKVMRPDIVTDPEQRARFAREAQVATLIESSHVVDVLDAGVDEATGIPFLVMEFLVGKELGDYLIEHGRARPDECVRWLAQAARALDKAHARGVVHRDLKPENMFLVLRDGEPPAIKILDFGIAKLMQSASATGTRATGTPLYMAPEQTRKSSEIGPATDIWALGLVAYSLLVGRPYWEGEDLNQLLAEILFQPLESPCARALRAGVALPPTFDAWFFGCVDRDPAARFGRASDAIASLAAVFGVPLDAGTPTSLPERQAQAWAPTHVGAFPGSLPPPPPPPAPPPAPSTALGSTTAAAVTERSNPGDLPRSHPARGSGKGLVIAIVAAGVLIGGGLAVGLAMRAGAGDDGKQATNEASETKPSKHDDDDPKKPQKPPKKKDEPKSFPALAMAKNPWAGAGGLEASTHEITREEYAAWLATLDEKAKKSSTPIRAWSEPDAASKRRPVTWVTWEQSDAYCRAIGARLPSSDEWGKLLGSGYPWGTSWPPPAAVAISRGETAEPIEVDTIKDDRTASGLADLVGNAQEWTSTVKDGLATVRGASVAMAADDAKGAVDTGLEKYTATAAGDGAAPESIASVRLGFRCVRDAK
jgi:serine/threonine-protein kinase